MDCFTLKLIRGDFTALTLTAFKCFRYPASKSKKTCTAINFFYKYYIWLVKEIAHSPWRSCRCYFQIRVEISKTVDRWTNYALSSPKRRTQGMKNYSNDSLNQSACLLQPDMHTHAAALEEHQFGHRCTEEDGHAWLTETNSNENVESSPERAEFASLTTSFPWRVLEDPQSKYKLCGKSLITLT